jgi:hypothetical protein
MSPLADALDLERMERDLAPLVAAFVELVEDVTGHDVVAVDVELVAAASRAGDRAPDRSAQRWQPQERV